MNKVDWDTVGDIGSRLVPGGYIAIVTGYEDNEDREFVRVDYDIAEGPYKQYFMKQFKARGYWLGHFVRSYKPTALPFFKQFKVAMEQSNAGYIFQEDKLTGMIGNHFGIVLGEEEYIANDGTLKKRLYDAQILSVRAIREGNYKVPDTKPIANVGQRNQGNRGSIVGQYAASDRNRAPFPTDDDAPPINDLPF